jgi:iron complex transport system substrate-binding protein
LLIRFAGSLNVAAIVSLFSLLFSRDSAAGNPRISPSTPERLAPVLLALLLIAARAGADHADAVRIVSLDYCADQFVLALAGPQRVLALSPRATASYSYLRERARGLPTVRPTAEDVLLLEPDLVLRSFGGSADLAQLLREAGVPVLQIPWIETIDAVRDNLLALGEELGARREAAALLEDFDTRLAAVRARAPATAASAMYMTPGGVSGGTGTLVDAMFEAAGLANFTRYPGWRPLPLERLAFETPDIVVTADYAGADHNWSSARHALLRERLANVPRVQLAGTWTACGGWFLVDAIEALAAARTPAGVGPRRR